MRVAIFVAVVVAHIALLWLFPSLRRSVLPPVEGEGWITPIFLPPLPPEVARSAQGSEVTQQRAAQHERPPPTTQAPHESPGRQENSKPPENTNSARNANPAGDTNPAENANPQWLAEPGSQEPPPSGLTSNAPDWRAEAAATAQNNAQHIVEAEDAAARKAAALTSHFKPLPGPRIPAPEFGWDYAHTHRITPLQGGGFVIALNDRCSIMVFIIPMIGCSVGPKAPPRGDLFKNLHPPVKFGDWDWRVTDP